MQIAFQLSKGLTKAEALRDILKENFRGELAGFDYDPRTGKANVTTRSFPAFPEPEPESDLSKALNEQFDGINAIRTALERDRNNLEAREAQVLRKENLSDEREKELDDREALIQKQREQLEKDIAKASREGLFTRLKSFFHTQT